MAKDGTEIDDEEYFEVLEPQTLFVIATANDKVKTGRLDFLDGISIKFDWKMYSRPRRKIVESTALAEVNN